MTVLTSTYGGASSQNLGGLKKILDNVFDVSWGKKSFEFEPVFNVSDTDDAFVDDVQIQMPSEIEMVAEGGAFARVTIENVRSKRYLIVSYKGELKITREAQMDMKYDRMVDGAKALAVAARRTIEKKAASILYNGFSSELSPDGVSLFNTAHPLSNPLGSASTVANRSQLKLNPTNLKIRRSACMKMVDEHGDLAPFYPDQLIVNVDNQWDAQQISQSTLEPGTSDNQKNVIGAGLKVIPLSFLSAAPAYADTMWFLRDSEVAKNRFIWREKPTSDMVIEQQTKDRLYQIMFRFAVGNSHYYGLDGNTGEV